MNRWNVHQKLARAIRLMAHFEARVRATRYRRTPAEKKANTTARRCLIAAGRDVDNHLAHI